MKPPLERAQHQICDIGTGKLHRHKSILTKTNNSRRRLYPSRESRVTQCFAFSNFPGSARISREFTLDNPSRRPFSAAEVAKTPAADAAKVGVSIGCGWWQH